ncbi:MAG TPA: DUF748 domain-containing protein [Steroidobacteraceae bacterium]|nr:DUF748 domain-containing protein [Steroidobacteraceae bacterium]
MLSRRRLLLWVALPLAVLLLLYAVFGFWIVPRLVRSNATAFVARHYHRQLAVGEIRFNPFTLALEIKDLSLPQRDGRPMIAFRRLLVDASIASVWRRGASFDQIILEQPFVRALIHPDGTLNLADLALPPEPNAKPEANPEPARVFIDRLSLIDGAAAFEDQTRPTPFTADLKPIRFDLQHFSTTGKAGQYDLIAVSDEGERFSWSGSLSTLPLASRGKFELTSVKARTLWSYIQDSVSFDLPTGVIALTGEYDFNASHSPPALTVDVHDLVVSDLAVRPQGGSEDYIKLDKVEVHETHTDVSRHTVSVGSVRLSGGDVRAWLTKPNAVNLLELTAPRATAAATRGTTPPPAPSAAAAPGTTPPPAPWVVAVPDITVAGLQLSAEDRQVSPTVAVTLDAIDLHLGGFSTAHTSPVSLTFNTPVNGKGSIAIKADASPDLQSFQGQAEVGHLDLTVLQPYLAQQTAMTLLSGLLSSKLAVERGADGALGVTGDIEVSKLRTVDNALKLDFVKLEQLKVAGIDYRSKPAKLRIHTITAKAPYARVIIESDRSVNVSRILRSPAGAAQAATVEQGEAEDTSTHPVITAGTPGVPAESPAPQASSAAQGTGDGSGAPTPETAATAKSTAHSPAHARQHGAKGQARAATDTMPIVIDSVRVDSGSANYADFWIQPHFAVGIQGLNGSITGLSSNPKSRAKVELQGKVDRYAPVRIWGQINPLAATAYSDIKMNFRGVEMTSATPYSGHFAGYKIEKGKLSVDIGYKVENRQLTAEHHFVIDQLQLGDHVDSPDAVHLPIKLAVALLKDRNGVIDIDLPVTGSLDDPQFRLAPLIWKAVLNLLTKIATAPFAALGHLFGGSGEEMKYVDFQPGSASLDPPERTKLTNLVKALKEKTQLQLDVPMTYATDVDRAALARQQLDEKLLARAQGRSARKRGDAAQASDAVLTRAPEHFRLLEAEYKAELGKSADLPQSAEAIDKAGKKAAAEADYAAAIADLQGPLLQNITVADSQLEGLGKRRAQAIQDALLGSGEIDPARVFVIGAASKPPDGDKVRVELSLK